MQTEKLPPPIWIATPAALQILADELAGWTRIAVDTESNSMHAFREQLCLIQFSTPQTDYLVDPLALEDLSPLRPVFANPEIEKVFHAAEYDLICLKRDSSITVANLFDTMQAARILGYERVGLDSVLEEKLGIKLYKKYQKADWGERPLSREMLNYARLDTHHLLDLRDCLQTELQTRGRWELAEEEFVRLAHGNGNGKAEILAWQRVKGAQKFSDRQLTILQELCAWREKQARHMNRPPFKVIDNKRLVAITQTLPETQDDLSALGLTARQNHIYGNEILQAVGRGKLTPMISRPRTLRPNQAFLDRLNFLSEWRKTAGLKIGVESDIILPKNWMHLIAERNPKKLNDLAALMPHAPWRLEQFGEEILKVLATKYTQAEPTAKKSLNTKDTTFTKVKR
ncbi:MAG: ribonuclease D [Candidatus Atribacteria bacterium]|nr:ribonuclease D [Candidatus Atribacteria bacterium]